MFYLLKTEPSVYSFSDLQQEETTVWDGVTNPVAIKNLRSMKSHDRLIIYHTGDEKRAVGTATVESVEATDPKTPVVRIKVGAPAESSTNPGRNQGESRLPRFPARASGAPLRRSAH